MDRLPTHDEPETKLVADYEVIRQREYSLINQLLELLPKIENIGENRVSQVRDALFHADHPFLMVFVGPFSSGKSSLINALCGNKDLLNAGPIPTTDRISILRYGDQLQRMESGGDAETIFYPAPLLRKVSFVDTPGLESVFQDHEAITRKFLHRSDVVILTMLATQAMTQRNLDYMKELREYGKKVIIVINQVDLLSPEERTQVYDYVVAQSQDHLKAKPEVWMVSAKVGLQARTSDEQDQALWEESGLHQFERYIDEQLDDVQRLKQKLQTPLQIAQNVHRVALDSVKTNQTILDQYQGISENIEAQLSAYRREQEKIIRDNNTTIEQKYQEAGQRGADAIRDTFQISRTFGSFRSGLVDVVGLGSLLRKNNQPQYARLAFEHFKAYEPIYELAETIDKLGPRIEGKDLQDIDDLVKYANREISSLPDTIKDKVIGDTRAPMTYDRSMLQTVRPQLEIIEQRALSQETGKLDSTVRSVRFGLAVWMLLVIAGLIIMALTEFNLTAFAILGVMAMVGIFAMPIVGYFLATRYKNHTNQLGQNYIEVASKAAHAQIDYGMQLRRDVVAPLTRLVETQTQIQTEQINKLQKIEQELVKVESDLTKLGKRGFFGR
jgi:GTPase SAR1 family protein